MLQHLAHICLITCIGFIWGIPLLLLASPQPTPSFWNRSPAIFLAVLFLSGLLTLSYFASWAYIFTPLRFALLVPVTVLLAAVLLFFFRRRIVSLAGQLTKIPPLPRIAVPLVLVSLFLFVSLSCLRPDNGDTQIYHLQIIQWANRVHAVPGIANLFLRIGLGSDWFNLISLFQIPFLHHENFSYLNVSLVIWFFIWLVSSWHYHYSRLDKPGSSPVFCVFYFLVLMYMLYDWELFRDAANSTSYDLIVTVTTFLAISFLLESIWEPAYQKEFPLLFIIITLSAVCFKFSGVFVILLIAYYLRYHFSYIRLGLVLLILGMLILPVLIKNYIITGYPLYPLSITIGRPDWSVPAPMVDLLHNYITLSNRFYGQSFVNSNAFRIEHAFWLPFWFKGILWHHKVLLLLIASSVSLLWAHGRSIAQPAKLRLCLVLLWIMIAGWFFTAPNPRFGYGILLPVAFLPLGTWLGHRSRPSWYALVITVTTISLLVYIPFKLAAFARQPSLWLTPQAVEAPPYQTVSIRGIGFHLPDKLYRNDDHRCYNTPVPCICEKNPYLQPRGTKLDDGFRMFPAPDSLFIENYNY